MDFWASRGTVSAVDWCEPNYLHSPYVAEWWNTWSSLLIVGLAAYGLWQARRAERRFSLAFVLLAMVGLGSVAFHGTLLKSAQASDELPMILCGLAYAFILINRKRPRAAVAAVLRREWPLVLGLVGYAALVVFAYFSLAAYFHFFLAAYALIVTYLSAGSLYLVFREDRRDEMKRLLFASVGCYLGGLSLLWVPEHALLGCAHPLQSLQLHAIFHLTSAIGSYCWLRMMMHQRGEAFAATERALPDPVRC
ncbi:MAG: ceramidase [Deltaproteobacteria bacterium]|nr:ceramidase [Deltaproteobacteria bacterium]